jgi:hypothetical protein
MRQSLKWLRAYNQIYMHLLPLHKSTNEYSMIQGIHIAGNDSLNVLSTPINSMIYKGPCAG